MDAGESSSSVSQGERPSPANGSSVSQGERPSSANGDDAKPSESSDQKAEEEESDLQLSWEVLELARLICQRSVLVQL